MIRFLANENVPLPSVRLLRQAGYDVASMSEDSPGMEDAEVLSRATNEQRVIRVCQVFCVSDFVILSSGLQIPSSGD